MAKIYKIFPRFLRTVIKLQLYETMNMNGRVVCWLFFSTFFRKMEKLFSLIHSQKWKFSMHFLVFFLGRFLKCELWRKNSNMKFVCLLSKKEVFGDGEVEKSSRKFSILPRWKTLWMKLLFRRFEYRFLFLLLHYEGAERATKAVKLKT